MNKLPILDARLTLIASLVPEGCVFADIGTDHGYLPVYLVGKGKAISGYACDIGIDPLEKARVLIARQGMSDRISTMLTDGLSGLSHKDCDCIIIAGMGGELIARILSQSPFVKDKRYRLVLQPMSKAESLRSFLCTSGFAITEEHGVTVGKRTYTVMAVEFTDTSHSPSHLYCYVGETPKSTSPDSTVYLQRLLQGEQRKLAGQRSAANPSYEETQRQSELVQSIQDILEARK